LKGDVEVRDRRFVGKGSQTQPLTPPLIKGWESLTKFTASLSLDKGRKVKRGFFTVPSRQRISLNDIAKLFIIILRQL